MSCIECTNCLLPSSTDLTTFLSVAINFFIMFFSFLSVNVLSLSFKFVGRRFLSRFCIVGLCGQRLGNPRPTFSECKGMRF